MTYKHSAAYRAVGRGRNVIEEKLKMKHFILLMAAGLLALSGCFHMNGIKGSGVRKTEKRDVAAFKSIESDGAYEIDVDCQKPLSVEIEGDDNILPLIKTDVRDGVLYISNPQPYRTRQSIVLHVAAPNIERITSHGAGDFNVSNLKNDMFELHSTGATSFTAGGQTKTVRIESSGAGKINVGGLRAEKANVSISGAASVDVFASDQLDVNVSGVGSVSYSGNPKTVNKNVSGLGAVSAKGSS
jgi:hypothetical protein